MRFNKLTVGAKLAFAISSLVAALSLMTWYGLHAMNTIVACFEKTANRTAREAIAIGNLSEAVSSMAAGQRGLLAFTFAKDSRLQTDAEQFFQSGVSRVQAAVSEIQPLLVTDEAKGKLDDINTHLSLWMAAYRDLDRLTQAGDPDGATKLLSERITPHYHAVTADCQRLTVLVAQVLEDDKRTVSEQRATAHWMLGLLMLLGAGAAVLSIWVSHSTAEQIRRLADEMVEGSRQVAAASGQVATASQSLAEATSEQAATLEETSSSTAEMTAITRKNSENTRTVTGLMDQTARLVDGANRNLEEMVRSMKEINGSSEKISRIIKINLTI